MLIAKNTDGVIEVGDHRDLFPNTSFPESGPDEAFLAENGCLLVSHDVPYDPLTEVTVPSSPYLSGGKVFVARADPITASEILARAKIQRAADVAAITVTTTTGKTFDGDEKSQDRMARAVAAMDDTETILWVLADNTPATVTRAELREALRLAGEAQTAIWVRPYQ